ADPSLHGHVPEAPAVVVEQPVGAVVRDEEVGATVVVVVAEGDADRRLAAVVEAPRSRLVAEAAAAEVHVGLERLLGAGPDGVGAAVAVHVPPRRAARP